jgi:hypothetical protein
MNREQREFIASELVEVARELVANPALRKNVKKQTDKMVEKRDKNIETLKKEDEKKQKEKQEKVLKKIDEGLKKRKEKENWSDEEYQKHRERKHKKYLQDKDASPDVIEDIAKPAIKKVKKVIDKFRGKGKSKGDGKGKNQFTKQEWAKYKKEHPNTKIRPNIVGTEMGSRVALQFISQRRVAGRWDFKLNIKPILYKVEDLETEELLSVLPDVKRKLVRVLEKARQHPKFKGLEEYEMADYDLEDIIDSIEGSDDVEELDYVLNDLYDWGDSYRVWLGV